MISKDEWKFIGEFFCIIFTSNLLIDYWIYKTVSIEKSILIAIIPNALYLLMKVYKK